MSKKKRNILVIVILVVILAVLFCGWILHRNQRIDWEGNYSAACYTYGMNGAESYRCVVPTVEIVESGNEYDVTVSISTRYGAQNGMDVTVLNEGGETVKVPKDEMDKVFRITHAELNDTVMYVELEYVSKDTIRFKYAYSEEELAKEEGYTLERM